MTHQLNVVGRGDIVARWCALAEQRLEYLTELFETGRWRRFHSELDFLENIQEAKNAVETWRSLSMCEASFDNSAVDMSWLGRTQAALPRGERLPNRVFRPQPKPVEIPAEPPSSAISIVPETDRPCSEEALSVPSSDVLAMRDASESALGIAPIADRYPLLRNAL